MTNFYHSSTENKQKGFGIISLIIFIAFGFALLSVYSYYNPSFSLSKYSPLNYVRSQRDQIRIKDLDKLKNAVLNYYSDNNQMPASDGWCGRISGVLHPEFENSVSPYFPKGDVPSDPTNGGNEKDYWYMRVDRSHFILMAVLELPKTNTKGDFNYSGCHDWPGNDVYNYQVTNLEN